MSDGFLTTIAFLTGIAIGIACGIAIGEDTLKKQAVAHGYASYSIQDEKFYWKDATP